MIANYFTTRKKMNSIMNSIENHAENFKKKGIEYTKGFLSSYSGAREFFAETFLGAQSRKYYGAKEALEKMTEIQKEEFQTKLSK